MRKIRCQGVLLGGGDFLEFFSKKSPIFGFEEVGALDLLPKQVLMEKRFVFCEKRGAKCRRCGFFADKRDDRLEKLG